MAAGVGAGEPATGFTLYLDTVLRVLPEPGRPARVYVPVGTDPATTERLRNEGWVTIGGLDSAPNDLAEARRLGCGHVWMGDEVRPSE